MPSSVRSRYLNGPAVNVPGVPFVESHTKSPYTTPSCRFWNAGQSSFTRDLLKEEYSYIQDEIGTFDPGSNGYPMRHVVHEKWKLDMDNFHSTYGTCDSVYTVTGGSGLRSSVYLSLLKKCLPLTSEFHLWCDNVYPTLVAQFPTEVSLANFIWELRELKDLMPKIQDGLSKTAAGGFLTLEFGWLPLIGDLQKLWSIQKTVKSRLDYLLARWGKPTRLGVSKEYEFTPTVTSEIQSFLATAGHNLRVSLEHSRTTFRASGILTHKLEWLLQADAEWHAMIGSLGFLDPVGIIWEAIPYSFVVDWFTNVGSWIERYGHIVEEPEHWKVLKLCSSIKTVNTFTISQFNPLGLTGQTLSTGEIRLGSLVYSRYERFAGLPVSSFFDDANLVSPKQLALLAALVVGHN